MLQSVKEGALSPRVNVIFVNYNGQEHLPLCMDSLFRQTYPNFDVTVVDNGSSDDSIEYLRIHFPQVRVLESPVNLGFGRANNLGAEATQGEYIAFTNYDVEFDSRWLEEMVQTAQADPSVGMVAPKILLFDERDKVNACGLSLQYAGYAFSRGCFQETEDFPRLEVIASVTGCSFLVSRRVLDQVGLFDPLFQQLGKQFYRASLEDVDLSWRVQLAGYRVLLQPAAKLYHKYVPKELSALRFEYLEGGRWLLLLKNYHWLTLLVLTPAILLAEFMSWGAALIKGRAHLLAKARTYGWLVTHLPVILARREKIQHQRRVSDRLLLARYNADLFGRTDTRFDRFFPSWFSIGPWLGKGVNLAFRLHYTVSSWLLKLLS